MSERDTSPGSLWSRCTGTTLRDRRNLKRLLWVSLTWAVLFVGGSQMIKRELLPPGPVPWVVAALPSFVAILVIVAYGRFLREADELQRLIHLEALALGFAGGWLAVCGYRIFERVGAPTADIADAGIALAIFYSIGIVRGSWRYR